MSPKPRSTSLRRDLRALAVLSFFTYPFAIVPLYYFLLRERGLDRHEFALCQSFYYLSMVVLELPTGWLADRFGRRLPLVLGPLLLALGFLRMWRAETFEAFLLAAGLQAAGHALLSGPPSALLFETLLAEGREQDYLRQESRMSTFRTSGTALAFLAGGFTGEALGLPAVALLTAFLCLFAALAALFLEEPDRPPSGPPRQGKLEPQLSTRLRAVYRKPAVRWILAYFVLLFFLLRFGFHTYQPWLEEARHRGPLFIGLLYASFAVVALPFTRLAHRIGHRFGEQRTLFLLPPILSLCFVGLAAGSSLLLVVFFFLQQIPFGLHWPLVHSYANHRIPSRDRALVLSSLSFAGRLGFALAFPLILTEGRPVSLVFLETGLATLLLGFLLVAFPGREEARPD